MIDATPLLRWHARRRLQRLAAENPAAVQRRQLLRLVREGSETRFGRQHGFDRIAGVEQFQERVPLRRYEDFWERYWQPSFPRIGNVTWPGTIPFFAVTSGTTSGRTKYIPCSRQMLRSNVRAGIDLFAHHLANRPASRVLGGRNFMLGGSTELVELAPGIYRGDLSGIAAKAMPKWARLRYFPPRRLETIGDWEQKIEALAPLAVNEDLRSISGTPSWLLLFFDRLAARFPEWRRRLVDPWPNLELVIHGGVHFAPYRPLFRELLKGTHAETREVYAASEGFVAVADRGDGDGLRLILDHGLFYEFIPVEELDSPEPTRHWLANVETGVHYAIAVTTCAGLWAYVVGDTVRFVERKPPRILITGRTAYSLSAFGEHLINEEIEEAVAAAAQALGERVVDYAVGAVFPEHEGDAGGHLFIVEFAERVPAADVLARFVREVDAALSAANDDYRAHRAGDTGMRPPRVQAIEPGTFAAWMKRRGQLGGQHKVPRIIQDSELFADLRTFTGCC
jgi:hypothetical protein